MRRAIVPFALVLALVTGVVLAETRHAFLAPAVAIGTDAQDAAVDALVRQFYAAVNGALATGDVTPVRDVVDVDFLDHSPIPGKSPDRDGILLSLKSLHATVPTLRLTVLDLVSEDDRATARIHVEGGSDATFLGLSVGGVRLWSTVDFFRVEAGRIVERWADPTGLAHFDPLLSVAAPIAQPARTIVTLERWTYAPGAVETRAYTSGFLVVLGDTGTLTVTLAPTSFGAARLIPRTRGETSPTKRTVAPGDTVTLEQGDALVIPEFDRVEVGNDGPIPAAALVVRTAPPDTGWGRPTYPELAREETGVAHTVLASGLTANLPEGQATVSVGRVALAPAVGLPPHRVDVAELLAVEAGVLALTTPDGRAWVKSSLSSGAHFVDAGLVAAGGGALVDAGTDVDVRTAGDVPVAFLLVRFGPAENDPSSEPPASF